MVSCQEITLPIRTLFQSNLIFSYRKLQWIRLSSKTPFNYIPAQSMTELGVNFKDACHRLWRVLIYDNHIFGGLNPVKCLRCREYTCTPTCIEERTSSKVSIDIGGKMTWIVTGKFFSKLKLSLVILTTFEFSRQKVDLNFLKMAL